MSDITVIKQALNRRAQSIAEMLLPRGKREGKEWRVGSLSGEPGNSLGVHLTGDKAGIWCNFATGEKGDLIDLWRHTTGLTFVEVLDRAREYLSMETLKEYRDPRTQKKNYKRPPEPKCHAQQGKALDYLRELRNLSVEVIAEYKFAEDDQGNIIFPFLKGEKLLMAKRREPKDGAKPKPTAANCEPILMGWHTVQDNDRELYITEGEIDAPSLWDYGFRPALSVPYGGGKAAKQQWIENDYEDLLRFEKIYLVLDDDEQGDLAAEEIAQRLGRHRCVRVRLPKKDANECLVCRVPRGEIAAAIDSAESLEVAANPRPGEPILICRRASEIEPERVEWLWEARIAVGKQTLIAGDPGTGKSQLSVAIAGAISTGGEWPCGEGRAPVGSIIILSAEDGVADTIVPRLTAAGADLDRIRLVTAVEDGKGRRSFNLQADLYELERAIAEIGDVRLIVIDPISSYMGKTDSHKNTDVRGVLEPIGEMAERMRVAVLSVTHFSKANSGTATRALHKFMGSVAFVAAARAAFVVLEDPNDGERRLFLHAKNNLAEAPQGLAFRLEQSIVGERIVTSKVGWEPEPVTITANEVLAADGGSKKNTLAVEEAECFLQALLADGPVPSKQVDAEALEAGIKSATLRRAKANLGVKSYKDGMKGGWYCALPKALNTNEDGSSLPKALTSFK
jgi:AAA domain/Toprim-like